MLGFAETEVSKIHSSLLLCNEQTMVSVTCREENTIGRLFQQHLNKDEKIIFLTQCNLLVGWPMNIV